MTLQTDRKPRVASEQDCNLLSTILSNAFIDQRSNMHNIGLFVFNGKTLGL